jgi:hypothetical protein
MVAAACGLAGVIGRIPGQALSFCLFVERSLRLAFQSIDDHLQTYCAELQKKKFPA